jgi:low temperature requirement protein LtrA
MRLKPELARRPVQRSSHEESRRATWLELFSDLAFVAAVGKVGHALAASYDGEGLLRFLLLFVPVWWAWVGQTMFLTRFDSDGLGQRIFHLAQIAAVVGLAAAVPAAEQGELLGYGLGYAALRVLLILQYLWAGRHVRGARPMTLRFALGYSAGLAVWLLGLFIPGSPAVLWPLAMAVDFAVPLVFRRCAFLFPPSREHTPERFGLFTIIVLGEVILAVIAGGEVGGAAWPLVVVGVSLAFFVWWIYFDGVGGAEARLPSAGKPIGYLAWLYCHLPLHASIIAGGIGIKKAIESGASGSFDGAWLLCAAIFVSQLAMHVIFLTTYRAGRGSGLTKVSLPHWIATGTALACVPAALAWPAGGMLFAAAATYLAHVLLTFRDTAPLLEPLRRPEMTAFRADQS